MAINDHLSSYGVSSTGRSWNTWKRIAFDLPHPDDIPTVTFATGNATALSSPVQYKPAILDLGSQTLNWNGLTGPTENTFRYHGGLFSSGGGGSNDAFLYGQIKPGGNSQAARWPLTFSFVTDSTNTTVEIGCYHASATYAIMVEVNGKLVSQRDLYRPSSLSGNSDKFTLVFPRPASRTIKIYADGAFGLYRVSVPTGGSISKPPAPINRVAFIGDSYINGAGSVVPQLGYSNHEAWTARVARMLGADDVVHAGIGGTGFVAGLDTGSVPNNYSTRVSSVLAMNPGTLFVTGSINDGQAGTGVQAAAESLLASVASVPKVYVVSPIVSSYTGNVDALRAAANTAGRPFIDVSNFIYGTGRWNARTGDGNRDFFIQQDNAHPTFDAHVAVAEAIFDLVRP